MTAPNRNALWARVLLEELVRCGLQDVCIAPGSRSTPLVFAAAAQAGLKTRVFLDERSAGFFALGLGKSTGRPAAVLTTSGTAVANLLPAVVEAHQSEAPLLLLTADRPHHLRDSDANQAIHQTGIFRDFVRARWDLPQPAPDEVALRHLRAVAVRAVASATGDPPGPVHVNVPLRKPLEPTRVEGDVPAGLEERAALGVAGRAGAPMVEVGRRRARSGAEDRDLLEGLLAGSENPVVVAGPTPRPTAVGEAVIRFAAARGAPLLADPLSGARTLPDRGASRVAAYDLFLRDRAVGEALRPDLVLRVGSAPTSASLLRWLGELPAEIPQVVVDAGTRWKDHLNVATHYLQADPEELLLALSVGFSRTVPLRWRTLWEAVDGAALQGALEAPGPRHEGHVAARVMARTPSECALFVSSSMPVRDVDGFGGLRNDGLPVYGNRGASGIDGIVSTAAGVAAGTGRRTVALLGDLAFLHDANGLLVLREGEVQVTLVVVNNDGGGIFHMLPVREFDPPFEEYFGTPHGLDLEHLARLHGIPYQKVEDLGTLDGVLQGALSSPGSRLVEIVTRREENRAGHEAAVAGATAAARDALDNFRE